MKKYVVFLVGSIVLSFPQIASAGFLDKINAATNKMNQYSQQMEQKSQQISTTTTKTNLAKTKTENSITGDWGTQVTCAGANSATCQNGMDNLINCMNQTKNYYYRLVAANLENKIKEAKNLPAQTLKELEADLAAVKEAIKTGQVVDADPKNPQRWLSHLTDADQMQINQTNSKYMVEVHNDCDKRFGGMSQYSN